MGLFDLFRNKKESAPQKDVTLQQTQEVRVESKENEGVLNKGQIGVLEYEVKIETAEIPSLDTLLKKAIPTKNGLYPHEIIMLDYAHTYKTDNNTFQNFWQYEYSVKNPQQILTSLYERGFIKIGDLRSVLERLKVTELKAELQELGVKVTGKKAELIDRLLDNGNITDLELKYKERYYELTDLGKQELKENEYVQYLHRHKYMSVWEMNYKLYGDNPSHLRYRDILWGEFNLQSGETFKNGDMGLYRNTRLSMYRFLMEEEKYKTAFSLLSEVVLYDLSGMGNSERFNAGKDWEKYVLEGMIRRGFPYEESSFVLPPGIIGWLAEMKEILAMSDDDFRKVLLENFEKASLYRRIFTNEECVEIVMNELDGNTNQLVLIYQQGQQRLKERLEKMG